MRTSLKLGLLSTVVMVGASLFPSASAVSGNTTDAVNSVGNIAKKIIAAEFAKDMPSWMTRTEIDATINSEGKPEWSVLTVQPLYQSEGKVNTFFTQGRVSYGNDGRTTANLGVGYRRLMYNDTVLAGINSFVDYEWPYDHKRIGAGLELRSSAFEFNSNVYHVMSGWQSAETGFEEKALDGYDFEIGAQVPYLPWAKVFATKYYWDSETSSEDIDGERYSIRLRPFVNGLEIEAGTSDHNRSDRNNYAQIRYRIGFGDGHDVKPRGFRWVSTRAFETGESMKSQTLERVRRQNSIIVEKRAKGTSGSGGSASVTMARGT